MVKLASDELYVLQSIDDVVVVIIEIVAIVLLLLLLHIFLNNRVVIYLESMESYVTRVHEVVAIFSYISPVAISILCDLL